MPNSNVLGCTSSTKGKRKKDVVNDLLFFASIKFAKKLTFKQIAGLCGKKTLN